MKELKMVSKKFTMFLVTLHDKSLYTYIPSHEGKEATYIAAKEALNCVTKAICN